MDIINITKENLENEHICCVIKDKKDENCISLKKEWLKKEFDNELVFKKLDVRGKAFIEYIPSENAWCPIIAPNFIHINCFWIAGKYKGQGYGNLLLEHCIKDAKLKGKIGLTILSSEKKMPFLSDPKFLKYKGFQICDTFNNDFQLLYLPFKQTTKIPKLNVNTTFDEINKNGFTLYYSNQCPYTSKYSKIIKQIAYNKNIPFEVVLIENKNQAQNFCTPFTTYSLFYNGQFITNEILSENKFEKLLNSLNIV